MPDDTLTKTELVRLNITDLDEDNQLFTDRQLKGWLSHYNDSVPRVTAKALRVIAASEVLVGKVISSQDLRTDGRAVGQELRALAAEYDAEADRDEIDESEFGFIDFDRGSRKEGEEFKW